MSLPTSTEALRSDVLQIRSDLADGKMTTSVARTLLLGAKIALDTLRVEMEAKKMGSNFGAVMLSEAERDRPQPVQH